MIQVVSVAIKIHNNFFIKARIQVSVGKVCRSDGNTSFFTGVGFSAGVDSLSSLAILEQDLATSPAHLVTLNVGGDELWREQSGDAKKYSQRRESISEALGFSSIAMDSNLSDFYEGLTFQATHTVRTAAAILSLGATFKDYYYSSGFVYEAIGVKATDDMSCADPILLPLFSTESVQFHALGTYLTRLEKVRLVCDYPHSYSILDVCVREVNERLTQKTKLFKMSKMWLPIDLARLAGCPGSLSRCVRFR